MTARRPVCPTALLICTLALCCGCDTVRQAAVRRTAAVPAETSIWLNPAAQVSQARRISISDGRDLRDAVYLRAQAGEAPAVLALVRNYNERQDGAPDPASLLLHAPQQSSAAPLNIGAGQVPLALLASPDHSLAVYAASGGGGPDRTPQIALGRADSSGAATAVGGAPDGGASPGDWPLAFSAASQFSVLPVRRLELSGGLLKPELDLAAPAAVNVRDGRRVAQPYCIAALAPGGKLQGGYSISYDPALPANARIVYRFDGARNAVWDLPYLPGLAPTSWLPACAFADETHFAATTCLPGGYGKGGAPALLRLSCLSSDGSQRLIEDRLSLSSGLIADGGVLFYTIRQGTDEQPRWELWAASFDGLRKLRLYSANDAFGLEPLDSYGGRRILLHRQYFGEANGGPTLRSELFELSLDPLPGAAAADDTAPLPEVQGGFEEDAAAQGNPLDSPGNQPGGSNAGGFPAPGGGADNGGRGEAPPPIGGF